MYDHLRELLRPVACCTKRIISRTVSDESLVARYIKEGTKK